jgi:hypothetical protein
LGWVSAVALLPLGSSVVWWYGWVANKSYSLYSPVRRSHLCTDTPAATPPHQHTQTHTNTHTHTQHPNTHQAESSNLQPQVHVHPGLTHGHLVRLGLRVWIGDPQKRSVRPSARLCVCGGVRSGAVGPLRVSCCVMVLLISPFCCCAQPWVVFSW